MEDPKDKKSNSEEPDEIIDIWNINTSDRGRIGRTSSEEYHKGESEADGSAAYDHRDDDHDEEGCQDNDGPKERY